MEMSKFTSIGQFRGIVQNVYREASYKGQDENDEPILVEPALGSLPTLTFEYTTKIHGTNAGIGLAEDGSVFAQSRNRILTPGNDNAGFAGFVEKNKDWFRAQLVALNIMKGFTPYLYGEWCGEGIQNGVAVAKLSKRFVLFAVKYVNLEDKENNTYFQIVDDIECPERDIYNIRKIGTNYIDIDFNKPEIAQNKLIEIVADVEKECPVGKYFGVEGIGEGVVCCHYGKYNERIHIFKVKGDKHAKGTGKVKKLAPVDEAAVQKIRDFVNDVACKEWRLAQMYDEVFDTLNGGVGDVKKTGDYIRSVITDVAKEEMDIMIEQDIHIGTANKMIASVARNYMFSRMDKFELPGK